MQLALGQPDKLYGPQDPPPLGVTTTHSPASTGAIGEAGGITYTYQNFPLAQTTTLYWSILNGQVRASMQSCSNMTTLSYTGASLGTGYAYWTGPNLGVYDDQYDVWRYYSPKFEIHVTDGTGTPIPLILATSLGLPANCGAVVPITDPGMVVKVNMLITVSGVPINTRFNSIHTLISHNVCTSVDWGYYWVNDPPVLTVKQDLTLDEGGSATITDAHLLATDLESSPTNIYFVHDPDDGTSLPENGILKRAGIEVPHGGQFSVTDVIANAVTYTHDGSETTEDGFVFKVKDGDGAFASDNGFEDFQFVIHVNPINDPPVANSASFSYPMNITFEDTLSGTDPDTSPLTYTISTNGSLGTATILNDTIGNFQYVPIQDKTGVDTLYFKVYDGEYTSDSAMFTVNLYNTLPVVEKDTIQTWEDTAVSDTLIGSDFDNQTLIYRLVDLPSLGTVQITDTINGYYTYTPADDLFGKDFFSYLAYDGYNNSTVDTVTITVRPNVDIGDLIVAGKNGLVVIDTVNQQQALISSGNNFAAIRYVRPEESGNLLVMDVMNGLIRIDPVTGEQTVVSPAANFSSPPPGVAGIGIENSGNILVADGTNGIVRVDALTGDVTTVSSGGELTMPFGLALDYNGNIFVADAGAFAGGTSKIIKIDPVTGDQAVISSGDSLKITLGITLDHSGDLLVLEAATLAGGANDMIIKVDTASGEQTVVTYGDSLKGPTDLTVNRVGEIIVVNASRDDVILVDPLTGEQTILATDGYLEENWGVYLVPEPNHAPVVANPIDDQEATEDSQWDFMIPGDAFYDEDPGDILTYDASVPDKGTLPDWLSFDPETRTFSGTPENDDVGVYNIRVTVTDRSDESVFDYFQLTVINTNDPPILVTHIPDANAEAKMLFNYIFPEGTFVDDDPGDMITYSADALLFGGGLPGWLSFDGPMRTFSGTPASGDEGTYNIVVTATDMSASTTTDTFDIVVSPHSGIVDEPGGLNLKIYPNPSNGQFMVDMDLSEIQDIEIRVLSLTGQLIWTEKYSEQVGEMQYSIDLKEKAKGIYNLEIVTKKQKITRRIVVY